MVVKQWKYISIAAYVLALASAAGEASGQTVDDTERVRARKRYEQALKKMDTNKPAEACPMLEEVLALLPDLAGAKLTLAECYARTGKFATAQRMYATLEQEAAQSGQELRRKVAGDKGRAIELRVTKARIVVPDPFLAANGFVLLWDGQVVPSAQWGVTFPIDQGEHSIEARLPGEKPWKETLEVTQEGGIIDVPVQLVVPYQPTTKPTSQVTEKSQVDKPSPKPVETNHGLGPQKIMGATAAGLGVVGLALGIGFGMGAISKKDESESGHCNSLIQCDPQGLSLREQSMTFGNVSTAMFITGSVLLTGGAALFFAAPSKEKASVTRIGVGPQGFVVAGSF